MRRSTFIFLGGPGRVITIKGLLWQTGRRRTKLLHAQPPNLSPTAYLLLWGIFFENSAAKRYPAADSQVPPRNHSGGGCHGDGDGKTASIASLLDLARENPEGGYPFVVEGTSYQIEGVLEISRTATRHGYIVIY